EVGLLTEAAFARAGLGLVARRRGDSERAQQQREQALALLRRRSGRHPLGIFMLHRLGMVAQRQGEQEHAAALNREVVEQARVHGAPLLLAVALEGLAGIGGAAGDPELSRLLPGGAATVRRIAGMPLPPGQRAEIDRVTRVARQALGEDGFASTFARGAALPMEEAVAVAQRPWAPGPLTAGPGAQDLLSPPGVGLVSRRSVGPRPGGYARPCGPARRSPPARPVPWRSPAPRCSSRGRENRCWRCRSWGRSGTAGRW